VRLRAVARLLLARRAVARRTERAGAAAAEAPIVGVDRLLLALGVCKRPPSSLLDKLISGVLDGERLGRHVLGEHGLGGHVPKLLLGPRLGAYALLCLSECGIGRSSL
jgi:hypothetical protein